MKTILDNLQITRFENVEDFVKDLAGGFYPELNIWEQVEEKNPDFSFFGDKNLTELISILEESGLNKNQIVEYNLSLYGPVIDIYEIGQENDLFYVMAVGER